MAQTGFTHRRHPYLTCTLIHGFFIFLFLFVVAVVVVDNNPEIDCNSPPSQLFSPSSEQPEQC